MADLNIDRKLLVKVAEGDESAFRDLYELWQPRLASFIFQIAKSKELTAEIVQDVFLKIWMSRETLSEIENFKSYLFVVSRNQAINAFRKTLSELRHVQLLENDSGIHPEESSSEVENHYLGLIDEAIDQLPPRQKEVYLLHRHQKLTYQQIADRLGIGKETVKTHLEFAIKGIKRHLKLNLTLLFGIIEAISENI